MSLADQLQSATEGSRELSDQVLLACGWRFDDTGDARSSCWRAPGGKGYDYWDDPHAVTRHEIPKRPDPTRNLQDAVSLARYVDMHWLELFENAMIHMRHALHPAGALMIEIACCWICATAVKAHEAMAEAAE